MSQQTACEFHVLHELPRNPRQSLLFDINPHLSFHVVENTCFKRRRLKIRIWFEGELCQFALATRVVEHKCIGQNLEQSRLRFCLLVSLLLQFPLFIWIAYEPLNTLALLLPLFDVKQATINGDQLAERAVFCLDDFLDLLFVGFSFL